MVQKVLLANQQKLIFYVNQLFVCLFVYFVALRPKSTAKVMMVSSSNHTFFLGMLEQAVKQYFVHILSLVTDNNPS